MEKFIYEYRPHFYLAIALVTFCKMSDSWLALGCSVLLAFSGFAVMKMRTEHRKRFSQ